MAEVVCIAVPAVYYSDMLSCLVHGSNWNFSCEIQSWHRTKYFLSLSLSRMRVISTAPTTTIQLLVFQSNKYTETHIQFEHITLDAQYIIEINVQNTHQTTELATEKRSRFCSNRKFPFVNSILFANWTNIVLISPKKVYILSVYIEHLRCVFARSFFLFGLSSFFFFFVGTTASILYLTLAYFIHNS